MNAFRRLHLLPFTLDSIDVIFWCQSYISHLDFCQLTNGSVVGQEIPASHGLGWVGTPSLSHLRWQELRVKGRRPLFSSSDPKSLSTQNGTSMATMDVVSLVTRLYAFLLQAAFYKFVLIWRLKTTILKSSNFSPAFGSEGSVLECLVHRLFSLFAISIDSIIFGIFSPPRTAWDLTMGLAGFACLALWRRRSPGGGV